MKVTFKKILLFLKLKDNEIDLYNNFNIYEVEAYKKAYTETPNNIGYKPYMTEIKTRTKQYLKKEGFKV